MKLLDVVAVINDAPEKTLQRGHVGTIVQVLAPVFSRLSLVTWKVGPTPQ